MGIRFEPVLSLGNVLLILGIMWSGFKFYSKWLREIAAKEEKDKERDAKVDKHMDKVELLLENHGGRLIAVETKIGMGK
jgi:hypothetical protein